MRSRTPGAFRATWIAGLAVLALGGLAAPAAGQENPFIPYYGKNLVHYGNFDWKIYTTDHFEIYYYDEVQPHLERVAGYAESAYQTVSADLKHDLAFKVPLILFKTHVEFEQQNVIPGAVQEGVAAFAEPTRNRMLLPIDEPPDLLYRTITHELTHIFEFDIIPQALIGRENPLWINEGLSDYETGYWAPLDLATIRDAAVTDTVPKMSKMEGYGDFSNPRLVYNLGHAAYEFMEARWGKEGIRQFLFSTRRSLIGGGDSAYEEAFKLKADDFDQQFAKYLRERFKPFRDKEEPIDYGRSLAPNPDKTHYTGAMSAEPSPSGDLLAIVTANLRDREYDIIVSSSKDGQVVRNLTPGFDQNMGFQYISIPGTRWNTVPWIAWAPGGDRIAYVVRFDRWKGIVIEDVVSRKVLKRIELSTVDEPESPCFSPDGKAIAFSALRQGKSDLFLLALDTGELSRLTSNEFFNYAPTFSPDGRSIVYLARVSGDEKLFRLDIATGKTTQITFGTHDDSAARFVDADTIVFSSTATDPTQTIDPEVARNGNIYNIWTLNLKNGELKQYTDALGANVSPIVLKGGAATRVAFVTYFKGQYGLHTIDLGKPLRTAATADFGAPGPIIDFQAPLSHTFVAENVRKKKMFEKLFLEGRPSIAVGVTNNGDVYGATELSMSDVLGDHRVDFTIGAVMQYTTFAASYTSLARRFQWAVQGVYQKLFYYGNNPYYYDPLLQPYLTRDMAQATRTLAGGSLFGIYPLDIYRRLQVSAGYFHQSDAYNDQMTADLAQYYPGAASLNASGSLLPFSVSYIQETTVFREYGPLSGNTARVTFEISPGMGGILSRRTIDTDLRYYQRLAANGVLAFRLRAFKSSGDYPDYMYFGGMSDMRGYDYLEFIGQNAVFGNAELRFPLVEAMLTPAGVVGGLRGVFFFDIGAGWFNHQGFKFAATGTETVQRQIGVGIDENGNLVGIYDPPVTVSGFRLQDARASFGIGLETFIIGIPLHFDWAWRTTFNKGWEQYLFGAQGASDWRKARFSFWIGYDF